MDPAYGQAKAGRPSRTYIQQLCEDTGCSPEDLPEAMNDREKWRERVRDIKSQESTTIPKDLVKMDEVFIPRKLKIKTRGIEKNNQNKPPDIKSANGYSKTIIHCKKVSGNVVQP